MISTMRFDKIFESLEDWLEWCENLGLYDSNSQTTENTEKGALLTEIYYFIYNRYFDVSIAYDYPDSFCAELGLALKEYFLQFFKHQKIIQSIYKLTDADFTLLGTAIMDYANNPNYNTSSNTDDWAYLKYISNQTRTKNDANKLSAYINALRQQPDMQINAFLQKIDYLWLNIIPRQTILFGGKN